MSGKYTMARLSASDERDERYRTTGRVEVWGPADWLKTHHLVRANLTPREARKLAVELLSAADRAEHV